ncbi:MAG: 8-oxo-dGTP pyrophosphatase MutT (NUDIX family) [Flavobacteriales bacterium]|jgi:8-oxo-dGTP pyrophosphatase MutT (NUDIX family)
MNIHQLKSTLMKALQQPLPGLDAQLKMAPSSRPLKPSPKGEKPRESAVLLLISEINKIWSITFIQRPIYEGVHSDQIAFPGGKKELTDTNLLQTAQRETEEEIGVTEDQYEILGALTPLYIPPSNFYVNPYIAISHSELTFVLDEREVASLIQIPIKDIISSEIKKEQLIRLSSGNQLTTNTYFMNGKTIWGATAMILSEFEALLSFS